MKLLAVTWDKACDWVGFRTLPNRLHHPKGRNVKTLKMPVWTQSQTHSCGFVVALMVLRYFRSTVPVAELYQAIQPDAERGTPTNRLVKVLRQYGVQVSNREGLTFQQIQAAIDTKRPILTTVCTDDPDVTHWVVLYGYGVKPNRVFVGPYAAPFVNSAKSHAWSMFRQHHWADPGFGLICSRRGK